MIQMMSLNSPLALKQPCKLGDSMQSSQVECIGVRVGDIGKEGSLVDPPHEMIERSTQRLVQDDPSLKVASVTMSPGIQVKPGSQNQP